MTNDEAPIAERVLFRRFRGYHEQKQTKASGSEKNQDRSLVKRNFVHLGYLLCRVRWSPNKLFANTMNLAYRVADGTNRTMTNDEGTKAGRPTEG
jgi:hypothetical protein